MRPVRVRAPNHPKTDLVRYTPGRISMEVIPTPPEGVYPIGGLMLRQRRHVSIVTLSLIAMVALVASCGNKSTNPPAGGTVAKELDSGNIVGGGVYAHTFAGAGTFNYFCTIHGTGMAGQVIVVNGSADSALVTIGPGNVFNPATATVKPTGSVRWINSAGVTHTVTSN